MRNKYSAGANFERRVMKYLRSLGMVCHRTAGSHTPIDVMAGLDGKSYAYQCQFDSYFPPGKAEALLLEAKQFGAQAILCWKEGRNIVFSESPMEKRNESQ